MELDYSQIGRRISARRRELKLSQAQVAELAETSNQYISNIERGVSIPSTEVIMRLACALETTPDEFLVGATHRGSDEHWKDVSENLRMLDRRQLALVERFIEWVREEKIQ